MAGRSKANPEQLKPEIVKYFLGVMKSRNSSAARKDQAAKQIARLVVAEERRSSKQPKRGVLAPPADEPGPAPAEERLGKKDARQVAAQTAHKGTEWDGLIK